MNSVKFLLQLDELNFVLVVSIKTGNLDKLAALYLNENKHFIWTFFPVS